MTTEAVPQVAAPKPQSLTVWLPMLPALVGAAALYVPTAISLSQTVWQTDDQGHGPLILAAAFWLMWTERDKALTARGAPAGMAAWLLLLAGLLLYTLGRSQKVPALELGSMLPVLASSLALVFGWGAVRALKFPLLFILVTVPMPPFIVDGLTGSLKGFVSQTVEWLLYNAGYPIARFGATLTLGQYQLLVADACSGLNSLFSLTAVGLFFTYLMKRKNRLHNVVLLLAIPPIAILANIIRVIVLCLVTYYYGDEAGQGFVHSTAGVMLFGISLVLLFSFDALLSLIPAFKEKKHG